jgi:hypothetical protein
MTRASMSVHPQAQRRAAHIGASAYVGERPGLLGIDWYRSAGMSGPMPTNSDRRLMAARDQEHPLSSASAPIARAAISAVLSWRSSNSAWCSVRSSATPEPSILSAPSGVEDREMRRSVCLVTRAEPSLGHVILCGIQDTDGRNMSGPRMSSSPSELRLARVRSRGPHGVRHGAPGQPAAKGALRRVELPVRAFRGQKRSERRRMP